MYYLSLRENAYPTMECKNYPFRFFATPYNRNHRRYIGTDEIGKEAVLSSMRRRTMIRRRRFRRLKHLATVKNFFGPFSNDVQRLFFCIEHESTGGKASSYWASSDGTLGKVNDGGHRRRCRSVSGESVGGGMLKTSANKRSEKR